MSIFEKIAEFCFMCIFAISLLCLLLGGIPLLVKVYGNGIAEINRFFGSRRK